MLTFMLTADFSGKFKDYLGGDNVPTMTVHKRAGLISTLLVKGFSELGLQIR